MQSWVSILNSRVILYIHLSYRDSSNNSCVSFKGLVSDNVDYLSKAISPIFFLKTCLLLDNHALSGTFPYPGMKAD